MTGNGGRKKRLDGTQAPLQSASTGGKYSGANSFYLMAKRAEHGYTDNRFVTASAANEVGLYVKKGERGVPMERWPQKDGEKVQIYTVFNAQQLNGHLSKLPVERSTLPEGTEKAEMMLKNAGVDLPTGSGVQECQDAIKKLIKQYADEAQYGQDVHTKELMALRYNIASTVVMREAGLPVEQVAGMPTKSWAASIHNDPSQLYKAIRDGHNIAKGVMANMTQEREANQFQASRERQEAQNVQGIVAEAVSIPRGPDLNLPDADLSGAQETVVAAAQKTSTQVAELRESATRREASASPNKLTEAREVAKKHFGNTAILTDAQQGKTYSGKIIGVLGSGPDKAAIQAISGNRAIVHQIKDIAAKLEIGDDVNLAVSEDSNSIMQGREAEKAKKAERARESMKR